MNTNRKTGLSDKEVILSRKKYGSNKIDIKSNLFLYLTIIETLNLGVGFR